MVTPVRLGADSGFYFSMEFFGEAVTNGEWDVADFYVSVFTKYDDNECSSKILFEIRKQKYLESLNKGHYEKALQIWSNDLEVFCMDDDLFEDLTTLLGVATLSDVCRERSVLLAELKVLINANPLLQDKLRLPPTLGDSDLQTLISLEDQEHHFCKSGHNVERDVVFLILQFLDEHNFERASHWLGADSGYFFDMKTFENAVGNGELDEAERYVSAFTKYDNSYGSLQILFEIRKQRFYETLVK